MKITTEGQAASVSDSFPFFYLPFESKGTLFYLRLYLFSLLETSSLHLMEVKVSHRQPPFPDSVFPPPALQTLPSLKSHFLWISFPCEVSEN